MQKTKALNTTAALSSLSSKLDKNYDLTEFGFNVEDVKQKSYIDFICKRNLAYKEIESNNIKDFIASYKNVILAIPSLAITAIKQYYIMALLAKNEPFFEFTYKTLLQMNGDGVYNKNGSFLPDNIRISMLENYLFNHYNLSHDHMDELNSMARLTNSLLLAASSNMLASAEVIAINNIIASIVENKIVSPTKAVIEDMIKQNKNISNEIKDSIINNKIVTANASKESLSL